MFNDNTDQVKLQDLFAKGNKLIDKRLETEALVSLYREIGQPEKAVRLNSCGTYLELGVTPTGKRELYRANFCKVRLCPMCMWRRSLKIFGQVSSVMNYAEQHNGYHYLFLTLTVRNCKPEKLNETINAMTKAFKKLTDENKRFKQAVKGWFRTLEITRNKKTGEYHPHYHMILAVEPDYFRKGSPKYIKQSRENHEWSDIWADALGIDYNPLVHVCAVSDDPYLKQKMYAEVSKYCAKPGIFKPGRDWSREDVRSTLKLLDAVLHGRRLVAFGGELKKIAKLLELDDMEAGDLTDADQLRDDVIIAIERYRWSAGVYINLGVEEREGEVE